MTRNSPSRPPAPAKPGPLKPLRCRTALQLGFLPESDCAPLVAAQAFGFFKQFGLEVELHNQGSWKRLHDNILNGQLEAAHAPAALPFLINLGLTPQQRPCLSGLVLSLEGNGISLSRQLWEQGVRSSAALHEQLVRGKRRSLTFGVDCAFSAQYSILCQWLRSGGNRPHIDVRIESVAPQQMFPLLKLGYLDGYCAGEPWNSVAAQAGVGVCVSSSSLLAPLHPEKVLMVRQDFARKHPQQHARLIAALLQACRFCELPANRQRLCQLLAQPQFVNAPAECLYPGLVGPFGTPGAKLHSLHGLSVFHRCNANEPTAARATWIASRLYEFLRWRNRPAALDEVFQPELFRQAKALLARVSEPALAQPLAAAAQARLPAMRSRWTE